MGAMSTADHDTMEDAESLTGLGNGECAEGDGVDLLILVGVTT